ncbi:uncharacterized protein LY79DRAFT_584825 [Colletotrichum navitas]|uniref:Uncharacterized protein n=1 Tax=Colletotrichum navitas TaxID=681940 RepID=A0AAD8UW69_9PEZI|nr:uncharacterized protein LY79DRAFT_584825 [Colletotrichum navitas]KAK1566387.1 hypothetical protein LY79DRAFT_584825 [Colletotrichum navitas]
MQDSSTFAAPIPPTTPSPENNNFITWKPLRAGGGIYNVKYSEPLDLYYVYTPYYKKSKYPVTELQFPKDNKEELNIIQAWNALEQPHPNGSPRLRLSDIIQAVAEEQAHVDLGLLNWVRVDYVLNKQTLSVIDDFFADWKKLNNKPHPPTVTVKPSSSFWPAFNNTPFVKAVNYALEKKNRMIVG